MRGTEVVAPVDGNVGGGVVLAVFFSAITNVADAGVVCLAIAVDLRGRRLSEHVVATGGLQREMRQSRAANEDDREDDHDMVSRPWTTAW